MDMVMSLDDFIQKYGEKSGTKRYYGLQKSLAARAESYKKHPYKRLTHEWFLWRYPEDGQERWEAFVNGSKQSLENFVNRYGQKEGERKYAETMSKKNTVALLREKSGENAVKQKYALSSQSLKATLENMSEEEYLSWRDKKEAKRKKTYLERYGDWSKLEIYIQKYGEDGPSKYAEYLQKIFKAIGSSVPAETLIKQIIQDNPWLTDYSLYYRDSEDSSKCEWFIADKTGVNFYDFCVKEAKVILEYDGARWHPTQEQVEQYGKDLMEITGISFKDKFEMDQSKKTKALARGFSIYTIRSDFTEEQKSIIIEQFINKVKNNVRI